MSDSVYALKPTFADRNGYIEWRNSWKTIYGYISEGIRRRKDELKVLQRAGDPAAGKLQKTLRLMRADARKLMTILGEAKLRRDRILAMQAQMAEQLETFPITFDARVADFHFNKVVLEFPWMPKWVIKANGKTYYVEHLAAEMGFDTRELDKGSTLGMLRFRKCRITLDRDNVAHMEKKPAVAMAA